MHKLGIIMQLSAFHHYLIIWNRWNRKWLVIIPCYILLINCTNIYSLSTNDKGMPSKIAVWTSLCQINRNIWCHRNSHHNNHDPSYRVGEMRCTSLHPFCFSSFSVQGIFHPGYISTAHAPASWKYRVEVIQSLFWSP